MHKLYSAENPFEAHLLCGFLTSNGISAHVQGDALFAMRGELSMGMDTLPSVWILHSTEQPRAELLLDEWLSTSKTTAANWRCEVCGEESEGTFVACWQCGTLQA